ncbi:nucleotide sugar dehydrogenase [Pectinatus haikarae]|uniref:UDP-N-acetyl-D-galactosamine dehydrogenase n=1 Tax=Pectinatus haikarae TaxID=349096 RepID=A0ABT9Y7B0_9FIRM|nr:nucleotide sugar dehydrogenase [Pectinatus haikarae]MDQ0203718.1 UDP-N-acetyl-D-galactosamine dehydrogenase [Pectinatus haikarae]
MALKKLKISANLKIAVVGLGYVGLPLAAAFSKKTKVIGFDTSDEKINILRMGIDPTEEIGNTELKKCDIFYTNNPAELKMANFIIAAVPTPINEDNTPNLQPVLNASKIIGENLSPGTTIVFESTVYPGVTEELCIPQLEKFSGKKCEKDFFVGYSPERINPGDKIHRLHNIVKIVSGTNDKVREDIKKIYALIIDEVYEAESIKVAEAAKLMENTQRDINIAFINEVAVAFNKIGISTKAVIDAMDTKWNALGFRPGLVGGHCIGVDPYYFLYKTSMNNTSAEIVSLARKINNKMGAFIAESAIRKLIEEKHAIKNDNIYIMGLTFKENCPDMRNSKVIDIIRQLESYGINIKAFDPYADKKYIKKNYNIDMVDCTEINDADCLIFTVAHTEFIEFNDNALKTLTAQSFQGNKTVIIDVKNIYDRDRMEKMGFAYWAL